MQISTMRRSAVLLAALASSVLLVACGGGSSTNNADTTPPVLSVPSNFTVSATNAQGAVVTYSVSSTDNVDPQGVDTITCTPTSGSTFPIGTTTVNCSVTDRAGNTSKGSFTVTVADKTAPVLSLPGNQSATATGPSGAVVTFSVSATDNVDGTDPVTCTPPSGSSFPVGTTTVNCTASDKAGNVANGSFTVTISPQPDTTPPVISQLNNITAPATSPSGATVAWTATATDNVDGSDPVTCTPASGSLFAIGATPVNCSSTDHAGNTAQASFTVTVPKYWISTGYQSTCAAVATTGNAWCWGLGTFGQLGNNTAITSTIPVEVVTDAGGDPLTGVIGIAESQYVGCALISGGTADCWGRNNDGQLGNSTQPIGTDSNFAINVLTSAGSPLAGVTALNAASYEGQFSCALVTGGAVQCWGLDGGDLGDNGSASYQSTPVFVVDANGNALSGVLAVSTGYDFACALMSDTSVECWGDNADGELGYATADPVFGGDVPASTATATTPAVNSDGSTLTGVVAISAGYEQACALINDGTVRCWGDDSAGQLGDGATLTGAGEIHCPLGAPSPCDYARPVVSDASGTPLSNVIAVTAGGDSSCALLNDGGVDCWGVESSGQLGNNVNATTGLSVPVSVLDPAGTAPLTGAASVANNGSHVCAVIASGTSVVCWGANNDGQLGNGTKTTSLLPVAVAGLP